MQQHIWGVQERAGTIENTGATKPEQQREGRVKKKRSELSHKDECYYGENLTSIFGTLDVQ